MDLQYIMQFVLTNTCMTNQVTSTKATWGYKRVFTGSKWES